MKSEVPRCSFFHFRKSRSLLIIFMIGGKSIKWEEFCLWKYIPYTLFLLHFFLFIILPQISSALMLSYSQETHLIKSLILRCSWCVLLIPCICTFLKKAIYPKEQFHLWNKLLQIKAFDGCVFRIKWLVQVYVCALPPSPPNFNTLFS